MDDFTVHLSPLRPRRASRARAEAAAQSLNRPRPDVQLGETFRVVPRPDGVVGVTGTVGGAQAAVGLLLSAVRSGDWVAVLMPGRDLADPTEADLRRARRSAGHCAVAGAAAGDTSDAGRRRLVEVALQLVAALEAARSEAQQEAGRLVDAGFSQREIAERLGVSQQAVHARVRLGLWNETRALVDALIPEVSTLAASQAE